MNVPSTQILLPALALAGLTLAVWLHMYYVRLTTMRREGIDPEQLKTRGSPARFEESSADNLQNLFELPVLFYAGVLIIHATGAVDATYLALAWAFVAARMLHSFIHVTYNRVVHRFAAYGLSALLLWTLWIRLAVNLLS